MANTGTISVKAHESFLTPAIQLHTNTEIMYEIKKDTVYDAIPFDGSYQIFNNQMITKPIYGRGFEEVMVSDPIWGVPFVIVCILSLLALAFYLPEISKRHNK